MRIRLRPRRLWINAGWLFAASKLQQEVALNLGLDRPPTSKYKCATSKQLPDRGNSHVKFRVLCPRGSNTASHNKSRGRICLARWGNNELRHLGHPSATWAGTPGPPLTSVQGDICHQLEKPGGTWMTTVKASLRKGALLLLQAPTLISITQGPHGAYI